MYLDYGETPKPTDTAALKQFLDDIRDGLMDTQKQTGARLSVVSEADITFEGYPARVMVINVNDVATYLVKTIVVKNRVYFVTVFMPKDDPKASDTRVYEKLTMRFIESFKLMKEAV